MVPAGAISAQEPISASDVASYSQVLDLSEDQRVIAAALLEDYQAEYREHIRPLRNDAISAMYLYTLAGNSPDEYDFEVRSYYEEAWEKEQVVREYVDAADAAFLGQLAAILTADQIKRFELVPLRRSRANNRRSRGELPEGNVDIFAALDALAEFSLGIRQPYELDFHRLLVESWAANGKGRTYSAEYVGLGAELRALPRQSPQRQEILDRMQDLGRRSASSKVSPSQALVRFNREFLAYLETVLDHTDYQDIKTRYLEEAYPDTYPDPGTAEQLYHAALALPTLDALQRDAILGQRESFRREHARLSKALREAVFDRRLASKKNEPLTPMWEAQYAAGEKREALNELQMTRLKPILFREQLAELPDWQFTDEWPPRPWDSRRKREARRGSDRGMHTPRPEETTAN
ncbi:MAG: hypothetical protein ACR2GY_05905 [Phycisphaerales bacterium]